MYTVFFNGTEQTDLLIFNSTFLSFPLCGHPFEKYEDLNPSFFHHSNRPGPLTNGLKQFRFGFVFAEKLEFFRSSAQSQVLCSIICTAWSQVTFLYPFERDSQTRFSSCLFHNSSLPQSQSNGIKYFRFLSRFCRVFRD